MASNFRPLRLLVLAAAAVLLAPVAGHAGDVAKPGKQPPLALTAPADFGAAVVAIEKATGAKAEKLPFGEARSGQGRSFSVEPSVAERLLEGSHGAFRKAGFYLFRYERSFGMAGEKDRLGLLETADHRAVLRRVGTGQSHVGLGSEKIVAWLDTLAKDEPFELWEIGADYVAGRFERAPNDPTAIAKRCAEFAPDLVAGRASTLDLLASEIKSNRTLYLIW
jgi:hypothetical protein